MWEIFATKEVAVQKTLARPISNRMMAIESPSEARRIIRAGEYTGHTAGIAPDYVQGNLCILPKELAQEFAAFCQRNPKPCPVIGMGAPGDPSLPDLGDIDIRTDLPRYRVFKDGKLVDEPTDIAKYWSDDLVTFLLGCSFSFELPILQEGIRLQHVERNTVVPMYRTSIDCVPAGRFKGRMVVSMRPFAPADAIRAIQITSRFPAVHGAPVHLGLPEAIGMQRHHASRLRRSARHEARRAAGVLGLRGDAAGGNRGREAIDLHHPQAGLDADHGQEEQRAGGAVSSSAAYRDSSRRTMAAPAAMACILPKATSRGRYLRPQSGATTMRSAGTCGRARRMRAATVSGVSTRHVGEVEHAEQDGLARQLLQDRAVELGLRRLDGDLLHLGGLELRQEGIARAGGCG